VIIANGNLHSAAKKKHFKYVYAYAVYRKKSIREKGVEI
jgi:hypothetical protein